MKGECKMTKICAVCGKTVEEHEYEIDMGEIVCRECMTTTVRCDECMNRHPIANMAVVNEGEQQYYLCPECVDVASAVCGHCGQRHIIEYMTKVITGVGESQMWCRPCKDSNTRYCNHCRNTVASNLITEDFEGNAVCPSCRPTFSRCEECGRLAPTNRMVEVEDDDSDDTRLICPRCDRDMSNERIIRDYGYKPAPIFKGVEGESTREKPETLYLGVELEIGTGGENHRKAKQVLKVLENQEAYAKHDGSVNNGFEIVTHPCTLQYHKEKFQWKALCKKALSLGYRGHDDQSCGMHVHINRKFLGNTEAEVDDVVSKMILIVENNWTDIIKFSRREPNRINQWAGNYNTKRNVSECKDKKEKCEKVICEAKGQGDRRRAVNITNSKTIEFRLFRSTLKSNTIMANLQFCYLMAYCSKKWTYSTCERVKFANIKKQAEKLGLEEFQIYCGERGM